MKLFAVLCIAFAVLAVAYGYNSQRGSSSASSEDSSERELTRLLFVTETDLRNSANQQQQSGPSAINLPEAGPYKAKINERLQNSHVLGNKPQIKERIKKLAEQKLNTCKSVATNGQTLDKGCVGRVTGQMMVLIAGIEKVDRNTPGQL